MTNSITMIWYLKGVTGGPTLSFKAGGPQYGTIPAANPTVLTPNGYSSSVIANQSNNVSAGPEGTYYWTLDPTASAATVGYHHPAGKGQTSVTVTCAVGYLVSDTPSAPGLPEVTFTDESLQQEFANITLYLTAPATAT